MKKERRKYLEIYTQNIFQAIKHNLLISDISFIFKNNFFLNDDLLKYIQNNFNQHII